jgi:hypothetical protein
MGLVNGTPCKSGITAEPFNWTQSGYTITRLAAEGRSDRVLSESLS